MYCIDPRHGRLVTPEGTQQIFMRGGSAPRSNPLPFWALSQTKTTDFPTLLYTSTSKVPDPFIYLKPEEDTPSGRSLPVKAIIGSTPLPPPPGLATWLQTTNKIMHGVLWTNCFYLECLLVTQYCVPLLVQLMILDLVCSGHYFDC